MTFYENQEKLGYAGQDRIDEPFTFREAELPQNKGRIVAMTPKRIDRDRNWHRIADDF
jgi:hypothetical protein